VTIYIPSVSGFSDKQVDAAAKALRNHTQRSKRLNDWEQLPNSAKKKWWELSAIALTATNTEETP
jgi:hypothetical protein